MFGPITITESIGNYAGVAGGGCGGCGGCGVVIDVLRVFAVVVVDFVIAVVVGGVVLSSDVLAQLSLKAAS